MDQSKFFDYRKKLYLAPNPQFRMFMLTSIAIGFVTFVLGLVLGEQTRAWGSFLFNLMYFFSIALGGVAFGHMQDIIGALWGRPIKRLHESFAAFIPVAIGLFILFLIAIRVNLFGASSVYSWIVNPHILDHFPGKNSWLNLNFMIIRDVFALLLILFLHRWQSHLSLERDFALINGDKDLAFKLGVSSQETLRYWSAPVLVVYALCYSILCFDLTMSLSPTWFSTLWAGWSFAIMMQTLMATILLFMFALRSSTLGEFFTRNQFHDIGKLLFGFTVFFAYLTYAHVLTYWYTNIPEETQYFIVRLQSPWKYITFILPLFFFFVPFIGLIPKISKWTPIITIPICIVVLSAQWVTFLWFVIPELVGAGEWGFPWLELGTFFGFLGAFLYSFYLFASKNPMLSIADPLLPASYNHH